MKKLLFVCLALVLVSSTVFAAPFAPTLLKLSASPVVQYDFDGSTLTIPVQVTGTTAGIIFAVYTKGKSAQIAPVQNGHLGWHYVNKVDTCLYFSSVKNVNIGATTIEWSGKDQDGATVAAGEYTYYLWAFDNQGSKTLAAGHTFPSLNNMFIDTDVDGMPLTNPIYYTMSNRWTLGQDPNDATLLETTKFTAPTGWSLWNDVCVDKKDHNFVYIQTTNKDASQGSVFKYKWVPGGDAEMQTNFGDAGYATITSNIHDNETGVVTNGIYLYAADGNHHANDPDAEFYIYDMEGNLVQQVDLTPWWSDPDNLAAGAQMNGGPNDIFFKNGYCFLNCHCSCLVQMVDPIRFLDSGELDDFTVWSNGNGDYILDHNFEDTAARKWVCMDFNVGPYTYTINADHNLFSITNAYDVGAVTFGLLGPDGTGMAYLPVAGETAGWKRGEIILDSDTPFDGMYVDNMQSGGTHYVWDATKADGKTYFLGHDTIKGVITSAVGVENTAPAAFTVAQNSPNPFNPTTTISFSLVNAGNVTVDVFNVAGQKVDTLANGFMAAGSHSVVWDASNFSAGVYFYTVKSGSMSKTMKMTLVK